MKPQDTASAANETTIEDASGFWRVTGSGDGACLIALKREGVRGGYDLNVERCGIDALRTVRAWRPEGRGVALLDADGQVLLSINRVSVDAFVSADGRYRMDRAPLD